MGILRNSFALVGVFALCGCQFFGNPHLTRGSHSDRSAAVMAASNDGAATQEGREHLRGNRNGLAIDAFNRALATGEDPAAAYNGLGVAYARIGRTDLAYRFFKKATMSNPANPAYAHNLRNLVDSPAFTLNLMTRAAQVPVPAPQAAASTKDGPASAARVPGKLYRDSNRQFSLVTAAPEQARAVPGKRSASLDDCARTSSARTKRQCRTTPLPIVQSRTRKLALTAFNEAFPTSQVPTAALVDQPLDAAKGKRKTVDLRSLQQSTPQEHAPRQTIPAGSNAAT